MLLHPAFTEAIKFIYDSGLDIRQVQINWNKERGARKKPSPGITIEEGPHPFGILAKLKPTLPSRIHAVERRGKIIIDPEKWASYQDRKEIIELGICKFQDVDHVHADRR